MRISLLALLALLPSLASAYNPPCGGNGDLQINNNGRCGAISIVPQSQMDLGGLATAGVIKKSLSNLATSTVYAAGVTTYASGTFTAAKGPQPLPAMLTAGQVYFVNFNQANPSSANLIVGGLPVQPIKVLSAGGHALTLVGGEIVPGPATLYYDGTEYIYSTPVGLVTPVTGAVTATQADFMGRTTFYLPSGSETITLPCANTLSPNGLILAFSTSGTATIAKGSSCSDTITKNGSSGTSATVAQGAALATVTTDGSSNFYVSGQ
jgi:hypothetical protein